MANLRDDRGKVAGLSFLSGVLQGVAQQQRMKQAQASRRGEESQQYSNMLEALKLIPEEKRERYLRPYLNQGKGTDMPAEDKPSVAEQGLAMFDKLPESIQQQFLQNPELEQLTLQKKQADVKAAEALANQRNRKNQPEDPTGSLESIQKLMKGNRDRYGRVIDQGLEELLSQALEKILGVQKEEQPAPENTDNNNDPLGIR